MSAQKDRVHEIMNNSHKSARAHANRSARASYSNKREEKNLARYNYDNHSPRE